MHHTSCILRFDIAKHIVKIHQSLSLPSTSQIGWLALALQIEYVFTFLVVQYIRYVVQQTMIFLSHFHKQTLCVMDMATISIFLDIIIIPNFLIHNLCFTEYASFDFLLTTRFGWKSTSTNPSIIPDEFITITIAVEHNYRVDCWANRLDVRGHNRNIKWKI